VSGPELQAWASRLPRAFPHANHLAFRGPYSRLSPDDIRLFMLDSPLSPAHSPTPASGGGCGRSSSQRGVEEDGGGGDGRACITGLSFKAVDLPELPLYLSTLLQLPKR